MFSVTVWVCTSLNSWCTMPMPWSMASLGDLSCIGSPQILMVPASGR